MLNALRIIKLELFSDSENHKGSHVKPNIWNDPHAEQSIPTRNQINFLVFTQD
jgi:hypothetical protein